MLTREQLRVHAYDHLIVANHAIDAVAATIHTVVDGADIRIVNAHLDTAQAEINQARASLLRILGPTT